MQSNIIFSMVAKIVELTLIIDNISKIFKKNSYQFNCRVLKQRQIKVSKKNIHLNISNIKLNFKYFYNKSNNYSNWQGTNITIYSFFNGSKTN